MDKIVLFYSILFYSIIFYSILFYSILFYSFLFISILFYSILFFSIFPTIAQSQTVLTRWIEILQPRSVGMDEEHHVHTTEVWIPKCKNVTVDDCDAKNCFNVTDVRSIVIQFPRFSVPNVGTCDFSLCYFSFPLSVSRW